jgi:hypothetical protein
MSKNTNILIDGGGERAFSTEINLWGRIFLLKIVWFAQNCWVQIKKKKIFLFKFPLST